MHTARDLALLAHDLPAGRSVEPGDLSLALAGAEAVDLLERGALGLAGTRLVPGPRAATGDRVLDGALAALVREAPYETVGEWLWRRGDGLAARYAEGTEPHRARQRRDTREPALAVLAAVLGAQDGGDAGDGAPDAAEGTGWAGGPDGEAVSTVLAAVGQAVTDLRAARLRRSVETAAFDNVWRG